MKKLFINEWMKIKCASLLWMLFGGVFAFVLLMGLAPSVGDLGFDFGITAPFRYMTFCGTMVMMLLSPVAGIFFTGELQQGTLQNTLSCGVGRRQYFMVKTICILAVGMALYLLSVTEYTLLRTLAAGFRPPAGSYPDCGAACMLLFQLGCGIQQLTYLSCFLLISVLTKKAAVVNLAGLVLWLFEGVLSGSVPGYRGPMATMITSYDLWQRGKVLTPEFVLQYDQCLILTVIFLIVSYVIFLKRDVR